MVEGIGWLLLHVRCGEMRGYVCRILGGELDQLIGCGWWEGIWIEEFGGLLVGQDVGGRDDVWDDGGEGRRQGIGSRVRRGGPLQEGFLFRCEGG